MIVSGIVIRTEDAQALAGLRPLLAGEPRCTPGLAKEGALAAALEFRDLAEAEQLHAWLHGLPGVRAVDVVRVDYPDSAAQENTP